MRNLAYILLGVFFGIIMVKSEAASWFRIQEMFRFQSFHMYGIICTAVITGALLMQLIKRFEITGVDDQLISPRPKPMLLKSTLLGGFIFGIGWAFTGACPGPLFVNLGAGYSVMLPIIASAVFGSLIYGLLKKHLPH